MSSYHSLKIGKKTHLLTFAALGLVTLPAYAYLDPGSGSLIIQSVIGALAAIGVTLKLYWHKIKLKLGGHKPAELDSELTENSSTRE